jgi:predicted nuclease of predicted toxin-antitoxin system
MTVLSIPLLLDQGLPRSAALLLRQRGLDCIHVGEVGMHAAADDTIIERARAEGRTIVTLDADFHILLALSGETAPSVIRIRIEGLTHQPAAALIEQAVVDCAEALMAGAAVTVQPGRTRIRRYPLGGNRGG